MHKDLSYFFHYLSSFKEVETIEDNALFSRKKKAYRFDIICNSRIMEEQVAKNPEYQIVDQDDENELF